MDYLEYGYFGLILVCFLAATVLPFSSEAGLLAFLFAGYSPVNCLIIASISNSLGGSTNYLIGRAGNPKWLKRIGFKESSLDKFQVRVEKYGAWMAWLSWVPIIGDPLTIVLGLFRTRILPTFLFMTLSKTIRYAIIIYVAGFW